MFARRSFLLRLLRAVLVAALGFVVLSAGFRWVFAVPQAPDRVDSVARRVSADTMLGARMLPLMAQNPGLSAVIPLREGHTAFAARMLLIGAAEQSVDARYYIWKKDATGLMLLDALRQAAERGVRVRLLLDDNGTPDLDPELAELDALENVEIRLFNPFVLRRPRLLSYVLDFARVNRRMHNKSLSVDGVATIIGGRNMGDTYFAHDEGVDFYDLDVLALGPAAQDIDDDFDAYWASPSAVPARLILPPTDGTGAMARSVAKMRETRAGRDLVRAVKVSRLMEHIRAGKQGFIWAKLQLVSDDPAKGQGPVATDALLIGRLPELLGKPTRSVDLISAYFVPGDQLTGLLTDWAGKGIVVRVLTNAQEATDVLPVHSGYLLFRDRLLRDGVQLYELKAAPVQRGEKDGTGKVLDQFGLIGSSKISLHAKAFVIDRQTVFIGSFNFDPRSARLNTEMGFLIENAEVASQLYRGFAEGLEFQAYRVLRDDDGRLEWLENLPDGTRIRHATEPGTTLLSRALVRVMGWLPIIWLL